MASVVTRGLCANAVVNLTVRVLLGVFALVCGAFALRYIAIHGDEMVQILGESTDAGDLIGQRLLVLCVPVLLFGLLAGLAAAAAWTVHARGQDEMTRTLDVLTRLKREGEVAVSARGLMFAFEEKLQNARRAFTLLLWLGRMLFVVCVGLFVAAVVNAMVNGQDVVTLGFGATSVAGSLLAVTKGVPRNVQGASCGRHPGADDRDRLRPSDQPAGERCVGRAQQFALRRDGDASDRHRCPAAHERRRRGRGRHGRALRGSGGSTALVSPDGPSS
jgi:hypothetical protein